MSSAAFKLGRNLFFSVAPLRQKALSVFVVLCIFINALIPRFSIDSKDYSTLCQIIKSQSILFEFFSFSNIPVKIVNELFTERSGMSPLAPRKAPKDDTKNTSNTSSDFSITSAGSRDVSTRYSSARGNDFNWNTAMILRAGPGGLPGGRSSSAPPGVFYAFMVLLLFYFLRARSALPDAYAITMSFNMLNPAYISAGFFLSLFLTRAMSKTR